MDHNKYLHGTFQPIRSRPRHKRPRYDFVVINNYIPNLPIEVSLIYKKHGRVRIGPPTINILQPGRNKFCLCSFGETQRPKKRRLVIRPANAFVKLLKVGKCRDATDPSTLGVISKVLSVKTVPTLRYLASASLDGPLLDKAREMHTLSSALLLNDKAISMYYRYKNDMHRSCSCERSPPEEYVEPPETVENAENS